MILSFPPLRESFGQADVNIVIWWDDLTGRPAVTSAQAKRWRGYDTVEETNDPNSQWLRRVSRQLQRINEGKFNATLDVVLNANATTTTLTDSRVYANSYIFLMPQTANAAAALANVYVDTRVKGSAVIHHASSVNGDQLFTALIIG